MKVICIKNSTPIYTYFLTIGKLYDAVEVNNSSVYAITNDDGISNRYKKYLFISLAESRKQKIDKIQNGSNM